MMSPNPSRTNRHFYSVSFQNNFLIMSIICEYVYLNIKYSVAVFFYFLMYIITMEKSREVRSKKKDEKNSSFEQIIITLI